MIDNVIFIIGCGHSGTTLLRKIIGNHKNIYEVDNESYIFYKKDTEKLYEWDDARKLLNKKWICEKTPKHVHKIDAMYEHVHNPKVIVMIRNGLDVIASLFQRYGNINESLQRWIDDNNKWINDRHKDLFHIVKYEDLIYHTEVEIRKICQFLDGEDYDPDMVDYKRTPFQLDDNFFDGSLICDDKHELLRSYQINQDIYDCSCNRYINDLTCDDIRICLNNKLFIDVMKRLEYEIPSI